MRPNWRSGPAVLIGASLVVVLIASNDWAAILRTVVSAGWALGVVVLLHLPQTVASAWAWRTLIPRARPGLMASYSLRWVRDSINTLLPVAQIGGDVVRIRLAVRAGTLNATAGTAATVTDVSLEMVAQIVFTLAAVLLLVAGKGGTASVPALAAATSVGCVLLLFALVGAHRLGLLPRVQALAARRLGGDTGPAPPTRPDRRGLALSFIAHLAAWAFGSVETAAALWAIGVPGGPAAAVVIEALAHVARAVGFFIPGALGVQEGGYVLVCGLYGIDPSAALSLSVVKRLRELALGVPGLLLWGWMERRHPASMTKNSSA